MNIIKLQDELRSVPDTALIGYVQNPTGHVPSYLALSELQRRKDMREKYQSQQAPQSSVADDLEQKATPQAQPQQAQGVASLPVPETMYQEDSFASGGIVAFDNGGDVDLTTRSRFDTLTDEEKQIIAAQYGLGADLGNQRGSIGAEYAGIVNQQGVSVPRGELRGRYMTDEGNQYNARYMPDARALSVDRDSGRGSVGADVAPGSDNSMGLRSIRGSYITDDGTRYGADYNVDSRQALLEQINQEGSRLGITASPDSVGVQGQYNFAQGGEVKHYAYGKGVKTDPELYDPFYYKDAAAALVPTRNVPTAGDYFKDQKNNNSTSRFQ